MRTSKSPGAFLFPAYAPLPPVSALPSVSMDDDAQPAPHQPRARFLARTGRHGTYKKLPRTTPTDIGRWAYVEPHNDTDDDHGYTSSSVLGLDHEPESIGPAILENYAEINRRILTHHLILEAAQAQKDRQHLAPQNRLATIKARAKYAHVDMSHEIHLVQREIDKARLKDKPVKEKALARLDGLEALLDGVSINRLAA